MAGRSTQGYISVWARMMLGYRAPCDQLMVQHSVRLLGGAQFSVSAPNNRSARGFIAPSSSPEPDQYVLPVLLLTRHGPQMRTAVRLHEKNIKDEEAMDRCTVCQDLKVYYMQQRVYCDGEGCKSPLIGRGRQYFTDKAGQKHFCNVSASLIFTNRLEPSSTEENTIRRAYDRLRRFFATHTASSNSCSR